jgi:hypothetical protein
MDKTAKREPQALSGSLLLALAGLAAFVTATVIEMRDPLKMMLEWELLAVFVRPETHGWFRVVVMLVGMDVVSGTFVIAGAGWLVLLLWRRSERFPVHVQGWLLTVLVMRMFAYLFGKYLTDSIGIDIGIPVDGFALAAAAAALAVPYFRWSQRVRKTFIQP